MKEKRTLSVLNENILKHDYRLPFLSISQKMMLKLCTPPNHIKEEKVYKCHKNIGIPMVFKAHETTKRSNLYWWKMLKLMFDHYICII